jgi:type I restriction enzyme S subunit
VAPGDLLFSNVFAWEGAVALASEREAGMIGSHRFTTYQVNQEVADAQFLLYYFYGGPGQEAIHQASPRSAGRNKILGIKRFATQEISLPDVGEQRRIATKLARLISTADQAAARQATQDDHFKAIGNDAIRKLLERGVSSGWQVCKIGEIAEINPRPTRPAPYTRVAFVSMAAVNDATGEIDAAQYGAAADIGDGYKQFERGDVIFARITSGLQNGKTAVFSDPEVQTGFGSTEFHVIRSKGDIIPEWIHTCLRTQEFRSRAVEAFTRTAGQQRVPASFLAQTNIPVPPTADDQRNALRAIRRVEQNRLKYRDLRRTQRSLIKALCPAILNAAFSGQL